MRTLPLTDHLARVRRLGLIAVIALLTSCAEDPTGPQPADDEVRVGNNFFTPSTRTVPTGTTVTWIWNAGSTSHNVTFTDGPASPNQTSGEYARTFTVAGTYPYECTIHGTGMTGTVVVE
jgi:plastocyanin